MKKRNAFVLIALLAVFGTQIAKGAITPKYLNEWMFDQDLAGKTLSEAVNSGTNNAVFSADTAHITRTDGLRGLICSNNVPGGGGLWTNGAILTADVTNSAPGEIRFLRYDFDYDMTSTNNNSGTLLGLSFSDGTGTNLAGIIVKYTPALYNDFSPPAGTTVTKITTPILALSGRISVIAKVDLGTHEMSAWYNLSGANSFNSSNSPNATTTISNLTSIGDLVFQATGDFIATPTNQCVRIDNIRTASTWAEIIEPLVNLTAAPSLTAGISESQTGLALGETNHITVVVTNASGIASNVVVSLTHDGGAGLSIINSSNAPVVIGGGRFAVQTFDVVANADGAYILTAVANADGGYSSTPVTAKFAVGKWVALDSYAVTNDDGGLIPGEVEPGETFDLIITSISKGGVSASGITNSLVPASTADFPSVVNFTPATYGTLDVGETTSTTYRVTCSSTAANGLHTFSVINRIEGQAWTNSFQLNVFRKPISSLSTNALTIHVAEGETASATVMLDNIGNDTGTYTLTADDGSLAVARYTVAAQSENMVQFYPLSADELAASTTFTNWTTTITTNATTITTTTNGTASLPIGFVFPVFNDQYTSFSASCYGAITFSSDSGSNAVATLPVGTNAVVAPFWGSTAINTDSMRFTKQYSDKLVVAWGNGTGAEFQAWLYTNGCIRYLYSSGTWTGGAIGVQGSDDADVHNVIYQNIGYVPGSADGSILLTPVRWITYSPTNGSISAQSSRVITITADASNQGPGTYTTTATVSMGGTTQQLTVTVVVDAATSALSVTPESVNFSGQAGWLASTTMTVSNAGNTTLNYTINDLGVHANGYAWTNDPTAFDWDDSHWDANAVDAVPLLNNGDDKTDWIPFGFSFPFYGNSITNFKIDANGAIVLDPDIDRVISAYFPVTMAANISSIRYSGDKNKMVVSWENMRRDDNASADQSFQIIAYRNGTIKCQYLHVSGTNLWPNASIFVTDAYSPNREVQGADATLVRVGTAENPGTATYTTNYTYTTNKVYDAPTVTTNVSGVTMTYVSTVAGEAILFYPSNRVVISVEPECGTLSGGETQAVTIYGDARSLTSNGVFAVSNNTTLLVYGETQAPLLQSLVGGSYEWLRSISLITTNTTSGVISTNYDNEYYFVSTDSTNRSPRIAKPDVVYSNRVVYSEVSGALIGGNLSRGTWAWGANRYDALDFNTIYVHISNDRDPDDYADYLQKSPASVSTSVAVTFTATNSVEGAYSPSLEDRAAMWGTELGSAVVTSKINSDGSRTISWPAANDTLSRTYMVWCTTSLSSPWEWLATVPNGTSYVDRAHNTDPVIFYKVTVE